VQNITEDMDLIKDKAKILKALSHPIRLCIVKGLMEEEGHNVSSMQGCLNIPQSTLSQHLTKLKDLSILEGRRNGVEINYFVVSDDAKNVVDSLFD
jgi:ArsR family transcriptional regulator